MDTPDSSFWGSVFGAGGVGVVATALFNYLRSRSRDSFRDRRQSDEATMGIIENLQGELKRTQGLASGWMASLAVCQRQHAQCEAHVSILTTAMNELREQAGMEPLTMPDMSNHTEPVKVGG